MSWFDILARIALHASKIILELAKYIAHLATCFSVFAVCVEKKIHTKVLGHFCRTREKSESDKSVSEDKDPKKLNL